MVELSDIDGLNLNHLFYFHVVAREGSIAAAGRVLHVSQSTLSEQIRELEATLGEPLFSRSGRTLALNDVGRMVFEHTQQMLGSVMRLWQQVRPGPTPAQRILRLGCATSLARAQVAADLLPILELEHVCVRVQTCDPLLLAQSLLHGELDLALSDQLPPEAVRSSLSVDTLAGSPLVVVAAERSLAKDALRDLPLIQYTVSSRFRWNVEQWLRTRELRPHVICEADDVGLMLAAVRAGRCFAVVPQAALVDGGAGLHVLEALPDSRCERYAIYVGGEPLDLVREAVALLLGPPSAKTATP